MVEEIVELKSQLQIPSLRQTGVFIRREIGLSKARLAELLSLLIALRAECRRGELPRREDAILSRCRPEYPGHVCAARHGLVIAGDVRIVQIIGVGIVVTPRAEWLGGYHCEGIPSLINGGAAKSPTSSKNSARTMSAVQSRYFVIK